MVNEFEVISGIKIRTNDRVALFGKTGSGKTSFAKRWLLPHYDAYVFWDIKHENSDMKHDIIVHTPVELEKAITEYARILYQPTLLYRATEGAVEREIAEASDFNDVCRIVFYNRDTALYIDEASAITTPSKIQHYHNIIMTQGRSYNVGVINVSQRPRAIHNTLISESEHIFIFTLNLETDIIKLRQQIGDAADEIRYLDEYYFMYFSTRANKSFMFNPLGSAPAGEIPKLEVYRPEYSEYIKKTQLLFEEEKKEKVKKWWKIW